MSDAYCTYQQFLNSVRYPSFLMIYDAISTLFYEMLSSSKSKDATKKDYDELIHRRYVLVQERVSNLISKSKPIRKSSDRSSLCWKPWKWEWWRKQLEFESETIGHKNAWLQEQLYILSEVNLEIIVKITQKVRRKKK